jgi:guanosine-3',5'-bis(diphosphate) 3'-pyrophosphohydrolase
MEKSTSYSQAKNFALAAHAGVFYEPEHIPYSTHLLKVAQYTFKAFKNDFDIHFATSVAWLHDVVEDTAFTPKEINAQFGTRICDAVLSLTKDKTLCKPYQMADSLSRIKQQPCEAAIVKMADRIANLSNPQKSWTIERRNYYVHEAGIILNTLSYANKAMAKMLEKSIANYEKTLVICK